MTVWPRARRSGPAAVLAAVITVAVGLSACRKEPAAGGDAAPAPPGGELVVGLVTDVGGRGDQSFNDSALRGLELWAAAKRPAGGGYQPLAAAEREASIPAALRGRVTPVPVKPLVLQSKLPEDYQPNLQLLVDQGASLIIGVGFLLENAVETAARANPGARFLLIDSPILDAAGAAAALPNVRSVVFREEEGSFLAGALAGLVAREKVGFVGGMDMPLIRRFEAGFRSGVKATNPTATVLVQYTGSFDNVAVGKQVGQDLVAKGCEVVFHAAGVDGNGAIQAVKEAALTGKRVYAIGVDSDQSSLAPEVVLTSMVKRVDLAVWQAIFDVKQGTFSGGTLSLGVKDGALGLEPVTLDFPGKAEAVATVEALRARLVAGELTIPATVDAPAVP